MNNSLTISKVKDDIYENHDLVNRDAVENTSVVDWNTRGTTTYAMEH